MKKLNALLIGFAVIFFANCSSKNDNANTTAVTRINPPPTQTLQIVSRPQKIADEMRSRGEQDEAKPTLRILSPDNGSVVSGSTVVVRLALDGDLKGYKPHKDPGTGQGNHIHIILDNEPYEAYYELDQPFELRNVVAGNHTLRVFPSRPWHESYKNERAFQMVTFTVKDRGEAGTPTSSNTGQTMANNNATPKTASSEGRDMSAGTASDFDPANPLLTYSRPKGEYKAEEAEAIMIDFWLSNAQLKGDGGQYRVRYFVDDEEPRFIDKWEPIWLSGWLNGKHTVRLELLGPDNWPVRNGGFNITTREITIVK